jgi:hypothetical protein
MKSCSQRIEAALAAGAADSTVIVDMASPSNGLYRIWPIGKPLPSKTPSPPPRAG